MSSGLRISARVMSPLAYGVSHRLVHDGELEDRGRGERGRGGGYTCREAPRARSCRRGTSRGRRRRGLPLRPSCRIRRARRGPCSRRSPCRISRRGKRPPRSARLRRRRTAGRCPTATGLRIRRRLSSPEGEGGAQKENPGGVFHRKRRLTQQPYQPRAAAPWYIFSMLEWVATKRREALRAVADRYSAGRRPGAPERRP